MPGLRSRPRTGLRLRPRPRCGLRLRPRPSGRPSCLVERSCGAATPRRQPLPCGPELTARKHKTASTHTDDRLRARARRAHRPVPVLHEALGCRDRPLPVVAPRRGAAGHATASFTLAIPKPPALATAAGPRSPSAREASIEVLAPIVAGLAPKPAAITVLRTAAESISLPTVAPKVAFAFPFPSHKRRAAAPAAAPAPHVLVLFAAVGMWLAPESVWPIEDPVAVVSPVLPAFPHALALPAVTAPVPPVMLLIPPESAATVRKPIAVPVATKSAAAITVLPTPEVVVSVTVVGRKAALAAVRMLPPIIHALAERTEVL